MLECRLRILLFHHKDIVSNLIRESNYVKVAEISYLTSSTPVFLSCWKTCSDHHAVTQRSTLGQADLRELPGMIIADRFSPLGIAERLSCYCDVCYRDSSNRTAERLGHFHSGKRHSVLPQHLSDLSFLSVMHILSTV